MNDRVNGDQELPVFSMEIIDHLCDRFEKAWQQDEKPQNPISLLKLRNLSGWVMR